MAHHHWAWVAGTCADDKDLGTPSDVPTDNVARLWPSPPIVIPPLSHHGGAEAAERNGSSSSSSSSSNSELHSPPLLMPWNVDDDQNDDYLSRTREVDGGERVLTKFDPVRGTCSVTFLLPRESTAREIMESARRLLRVPLGYRIRLNEVPS